MAPSTRKMYRKKSVKATRKKPYRKSASVVSVKKIVKKAIAASVENKTKQYLNTSSILYSSNDASLLDTSIIPVTPYSTYLSIDQGVGNGSRIGNVVTTKKLMFKGTIVPTPYDSIFNTLPVPMQIKMWIFYDKTNPTSIPTPAISADFFQFNNAAAGFKNDLVDLWAPINTDKYRVVASRTFKVGYAQASGTGSSAANQGFSNNDFKYNANFSLNLTKFCNKRVKFNDNQVNPTSRGLFCLFQVISANGAPIGGGQRLANVQYMLDYVYEDA